MRCSHYSATAKPWKKSARAAKFWSATALQTEELHQRLVHRIRDVKRRCPHRRHVLLVLRAFHRRYRRPQPRAQRRGGAEQSRIATQSAERLEHAAASPAISQL